MKITFTWDEFKQLAYTKIKETYPDIVDDDTVEFKIIHHDGPRDICDIPDEVIITLKK